MVGGIIGGVSAAINGEDVSAGIAGGAVSGAIFGMVADLTVVSGGVATPVAAVIAGTIIGGATAGAAGDFTTQVVSNTNKGHSLQEAVNKVDLLSLGVSAFCGVAAGGLSYYVGNLIRNVVFEPVKKAMVDNAIRHALGETTDYLWKPIISAATRAGLITLGADALISIGQTVMYYGVNRFIRRYVTSK